MKTLAYHVSVCEAINYVFLTYLMHKKFKALFQFHFFISPGNFSERFKSETLMLTCNPNVCVICGALYMRNHADK